MVFVPHIADDDGGAREFPRGGGRLNAPLIGIGRIARSRSEVQVNWRRVEYGWKTQPEKPGAHGESISG